MATNGVLGASTRTMLVFAGGKDNHLFNLVKTQAYVFSNFKSPRWLIANDRHEEALDVMATYHGDGERDSPIVQLEYREMCEAISKTGSDKRWWDYRELVNSKEVRYRSMLVLFVGMLSINP